MNEGASDGRVLDRREAVDEHDAIDVHEAEDAVQRRRHRVPVVTMGLSDDGGRSAARHLPTWVEPLRARWRAEAEERRKLAPIVHDVPSYFVFDDVLVGLGAVTTLAEHDDPLGALDALAIQAVVAQVGGSVGAITLSVAIEMSADRRNWVAKNATPEINAVALSTTATTVAVGTDAGATPSLGFVRLRISLATGLGTPTARVRLHVKSRSK